MAITFNRRPNGVSIPSSSDTKQYYFNHCNWKGVNQNRNFLVVDQETFADSKNVYVDEEGILKSRLPLKLKRKFNDKILKDIKVFDRVFVCSYLSLTSEWYIGIFDGEDWIVNYRVLEDYPLKVFRNGNYIYIFTNIGVITYDLENRDAIDTSFFNPITRIYNGLSFETYDDENLMSSKNRYRYILFPTYPSDDGNYLPDGINNNVYGKTGTYVHFVNENKISHTVEMDSEKSFLNVIHQPLFSFTDNFNIYNRWNIRTPTWVIRNQQIYRYNEERKVIETASLSDGLFITLSDLSGAGFGEFVKIRLASTNYVIVIFKQQVIRISPTNEVEYGWGGDEFVDYNEVYYKNELIRTEVAFNQTIDLNDYGNLQVSFYQRESGTTYNVKLNTNVKYDAIRSIESDIVQDNQLNLYFAFSIYYNGTTTSGTSGIFNYSELIYIPGARNNTYFKTLLYKSKLTLSGNYSLTLTGWGSSNYDELMFQPIINVEYDIFDQPIVSGAIRHRNIDSNVDDYFKAPTVLYGELSTNQSKLAFSYSYVSSSNYLQYFKNGLFISNSRSLAYKYKNKSVEFVTTLPGTLTTNSNYWLYSLNDETVTLSNYRLLPQNIDVEIVKTPAITDFDIIIKSDKFYASKNNNFYIGEIIIDPDDDKEKLYFKKEYKHMLDNVITGLHPISNSELAIFTTDGIWYMTNSDGIYYYSQSKIIPTLKGKSELITLPDSTTTLMPSSYGVIVLSYQNFVNTTEQSTINLTQDLNSIYNLFNGDVRAINWKFYTILYERDNRMILIYDNRLSSWWRWELFIPISVLFVYNEDLYSICDGSIYKFVDEPNQYFDEYNDSNLNIDWFIESQKLHFGANNNYKHITNLTLCSVQNCDNPISLNLNIKNYRKWIDEGKAENFDYHIDVIRTYVKRLNYAKVCEFQYKLSSDNNSAINIPLALSDITIKYKIGGQIR